MRRKRAPVGSLLRTTPMRGSFTWWRSTTPMAPVVNRHDRRLRPFRLRLGNPATPLRRPVRASKKLPSALANASRPELYASFEFSAHHGATWPLSRFHSRRKAGSDHGTRPTNPRAHLSASAADAPWRTANTVSTRPASIRPATSASPQL